MASFASRRQGAGVPVVMSVVGDSYMDPCRIMILIWEGSTISGDTISLVDQFTNEIIWKGRTADTQTYLGTNFSTFGISCPHGFKLAQVSNGSLYIYIAEA